MTMVRKPYFTFTNNYANIHTSKVYSSLMAGSVSGGSIGSGANSYFGPRIITLQQILQQLDMNQLKHLCNLLSIEIKNVVVNVLGRILKGHIQLVNLLEMFGGNSIVRSNVIEIMTNFFKGIYGKRIRSIAA